MKNGTDNKAFKKDFSSCFAATDDLGRSLPTVFDVGIMGSKGEFYVGLFYFMWMGEHGDSGAFDLNKIAKKYGDDAKYVSCGGYGNEQEMHFWGEPLYGYYYSRDEWVIRKHIELFTNAGVDFLYFDVTNGFSYIPTAKKVMNVCDSFIKQGFKAPKVVFYTHTNSKNLVRQVYDEIYSVNYCPDTWFYVDGKPVIVSYYEDNIDDFFTVRLPQWPNEPANTEPSWPWMDFQWPQRVFQNEGKGESISVSIAQHSGSVRFSSSAFYGDTSNRGRSTKTVFEDRSTFDGESYKEGRNFEAQWDRVLECVEKSKTDPYYNIKYVLITGWNEWVAQRQSSSWIKGEEIFFVDTASPEYSRDVEMMRGGYFDSYYLQMISLISRLKGTYHLVESKPQRVDVTGDFSAWDKVDAEYRVPVGNISPRRETGFGHTLYINESGRNEIEKAKVANDGENLYFYVSTVEDISPYCENSTWMQLFVNTDGDSQNGWYGYDYIINYSLTEKGVSVAKNSKRGEFEFSHVGYCKYKLRGRELMIEVPLCMLGIKKGENIYLEFKWADSKEKITSMEGFYESGDSAPLGRLNWIYKSNGIKENLK